MGSISNAKEFAAAAERIYREKFQEQYEVAHLGSFLAIDVVSEKVYLGASALDALKAARRAAPDGFFYLLRIGYTRGFQLTDDHA